MSNRKLLKVAGYFSSAKGAQGIRGASPAQKPFPSIGKGVLIDERHFSTLFSLSISYTFQPSRNQEKLCSSLAFLCVLCNYGTMISEDRQMREKGQSGKGNHLGLNSMV